MRSLNVLKCHLRWVGAPPGNMHRPCKVLFDSAGAGGQDAECLILFYSSNANTNTKHSTLNLNRNGNKPQTQTQTSTFIPNSQTANCRVGTWMCLVIAMNAQEPRPPCVQRHMFLRQDALGKPPVPMIDDGERQPPPEPKTLAVVATTTSNATAVTTMTTQHGSR